MFRPIVCHNIDVNRAIPWIICIHSPPTYKYSNWVICWLSTLLNPVENKFKFFKRFFKNLWIGIIGWHIFPPSLLLYLVHHTPILQDPVTFEKERRFEYPPFPLHH